jgi:hypothetical protein
MTYKHSYFLGFLRSIFLTKQINLSNQHIIFFQNKSAKDLTNMHIGQAVAMWQLMRGCTALHINWRAGPTSFASLQRIPTQLHSALMPLQSSHPRKGACSPRHATASFQSTPL